jgi:curved DNA-binding protein CbpA
MSDDHYNTLGVAPSASGDDIKSRFRFLSQAYHPDKFGTEKHKKEAEEEFKRINSAYQVLSDPTERSRYDASRTGSFRQSGNSGQWSRRRENKPHSPPKSAQPPQPNRSDEPVDEQHLDIWASAGGLIAVIIGYALMYLLGVLFS